MHIYIFWAIIAIITLDFLFENFLDYLNTRNMGQKLPPELSGIYDAEKYKRQQSYQKENHRFGMITGTLSFIVLLAMFLLYGFAYVDSIVWNITSNSIVASLLFFGILS